MRELSLAQKAMLNGLICPYCKNPSIMINTVEGKQVGCDKCGAWMRSDSMGNPIGRLAKPGLLKTMDMVGIEIDEFLRRTGQDKLDFRKELSGELGIPQEYISPYKMSLTSLLKVMRHIKAYSESHVRIHDRDEAGRPCPRHAGVAIGSGACHGCPEHLFHVVDNLTDTVVCDMDMRYGKRKIGDK